MDQSGTGYEEIIRKAIQARDISYSPYSDFMVGACLETKDGKQYMGCNIENAAYTPTNCAERTAFFKAISEGKREFVKIAIVGGKRGEALELCPPCGVCRQVMMEFCKPDSFEIVLATSVNEYKVYRLNELMPMGFGPNQLDKKRETYK